MNEEEVLKLMKKYGKLQGTIDNPLFSDRQFVIELLKDRGWDFKNKREELIKMMRTALENNLNPTMAMDLVDAVIVAVWEHYGIIDSSNPTKENK